MKLIIVGNASASNQLFNDCNSATYLPSVVRTMVGDTDYSLHDIDDKTRICLWRTQGWERFPMIAHSYIKSSDVALVLLDHDKDPNFIFAQKRMQTIQKSNDEICVLLVSRNNDGIDIGPIWKQYKEGPVNGCVLFDKNNKYDFFRDIRSYYGDYLKKKRNEKKGVAQGRVLANDNSTGQCITM